MSEVSEREKELLRAMATQKSNFMEAWTTGFVLTQGQLTQGQTGGGAAGGSYVIDVTAPVIDITQMGSPFREYLLPPRPSAFGQFFSTGAQLMASNEFEVQRAEKPKVKPEPFENPEGTRVISLEDE